jgi:hypothetical protein
VQLVPLGVLLVKNDRNKAAEFRRHNEGTRSPSLPLLDRWKKKVRNHRKRLKKGVGMGWRSGAFVTRFQERSESHAHSSECAIVTILDKNLAAD